MGMLVLFVILGKKQNKQTNPRNTTYQNLWDDADAAKVVLRGKLIEINPYIKKKKKKSRGQKNGVGKSLAM